MGRALQEPPAVPVLVERIRGAQVDGYEVFAGKEPKAVGRVLRISKESHIRRHRMQVSPWWRPLNLAGQAVGERTWRGQLVDYQTRFAAINRLLDVGQYDFVAAELEVREAAASVIEASAIDRWLTTPAPIFEGRSAHDLLNDGASGRDRVLASIDQLASGAFI